MAATASGAPSPPAPPWARPFASPARRAAWARRSLFALAACDLVVAITGPAANGPAPALVEVLFAIGSVGAFGALIACAISVPAWCHRVYRNLPALGVHATRFTPGWAAGWWFVPLFNLVRPYQVLREIWVDSRTKSEGWLLLKRGWALFLVGGFLSDCTLTTSDAHFDAGLNSVLNSLGWLLRAGGALTAAAIVGRVTRWHLERAANP
ncbi:MAG: DUF4328 domain-containing protein [Chloroflexota bacterium]